MPLSELVVFTGRFGSGKTEIALNYAVRLSEQGSCPLLIDLDIVTPYFRARDKAEELAHLGVQVIAPSRAGQHLHVPAISPQILGAIEQRTRPVAIDLGGDEHGARALAQYAPAIHSRDHALIFVVNPYRPFMDTVAGIRTAASRIEASARARVSHLASNPNLMSQSSPQTFERGHQLVRQASQALDLPLAFAIVSERLSPAIDRHKLGVDVLVIHRFLPMFDAPDPQM
jgi:hypothetical protein